jgi:putative DNA primase/helicase
MSEAMLDDNILSPEPRSLTAVDIADAAFLTKTEMQHGWTHDELGQLFAAGARDVIRFEKARGWFFWNGVRWELDSTDFVVEKARQYLRRRTNNYSLPSTQALGRAGWAKSMLEVVGAIPSIAIKAADWDKDPFVIGTPSGAVDLRTGAFLKADPDMLISKGTAVDPANNDAQCPRWLQFLDEVTGRDDDAIRGLQRLAGYALTAETRAEKVFILVGDGENGKSAFLEALEYAFGDFAQTVPFSVLLMDRNDDKPSTAFAPFHGARLVVANETKQGSVWDDGTVKLVTGGDKMTAKKLYHDAFSFKPTHTLVVSLNSKAMPEFRIIDTGIRRRVLIAPFTFKPKVVDYFLKDKLREEAAGILRWAINGAVAWYEEGITIPETWAKATRTFLEEQSRVADKRNPKETFPRWIDECCLVNEA